MKLDKQIDEYFPSLFDVIKEFKFTPFEENFYKQFEKFNIEFFLLEKVLIKFIDYQKDLEKWI